MDERYYMLGALGLLLVGLVLYFIISLVRYRSAVRKARALQAGQEDEGEARYIDASAEHEDVFSAPVMGERPLGAAPQAQVYDFSIPAVHTPMPPQAAPPAAELAELDLTLEQPGEPATIPTIAEAEPSAVELPQAEESAEWILPPMPQPVADAAPVIVPAPEPESAREPELEPILASELEPQAEAVRASEPVLVSAVEPPPDQVTWSEPLAEPAPAPAPAPLPEPILAPVPELEPVPEPEPASELPPEPAPLPGYSLADELERLMAAATAVTPTLLSPAEHEAALTPIPKPEPEPEPDFSASATPIIPPPSVGQVLSTAKLPIAPEASPEPVSAHEDVEALSAEPPAARPEPPDIPEYTLVAPVELHFTVGESRIGVKPGTRSHAEFQRLAGIMLDDLRAARDR